jgi:DNA-binding NarL/FixJ family response regulator
MPIRIAIVEDDRETLKECAALLALEGDFSVVGSYETIESALQEVPSVKPDVILMDILFCVGQHKEYRGIYCARELKDKLPDSAILMLTVLEDDENISAAIRNGADGYVLKGAQKELISAIREVVAGGSPMIPSGIARRLIRWIQRAQPACPELDSLSERQLSILQLIAQGLRDVDIARELDISEETVGTYLRRLYKKLHVHTRSQAVAKLLTPGNPPGKTTGKKRKQKL